MLKLPKPASLRHQLCLLFCFGMLIHLCIPLLFYFIHIPNEYLWSILVSFLCCTTILILVLTIVNNVLAQFEKISEVSINFGKNPNCQQKKIPELGTSEVIKATQAFNSMRRQIQNLLRERDDMFTAIAHDIRTPLAHIQMTSEMLDDDRFKDNIQNNVMEISSILEKGLALSKNGLSAELPQILDLASFIENLTEEIKGHSPQVECIGCADGTERICVKARPSGIEICLRNLVANAIAYGKGSVFVSVSCSKEFAYVDVIDNGPGIPDCCIDRVMQPFFRLEGSRNKSSGGSGLGLSIAQNAARLDNGEIRLSNRKEGGLLARLSLPRHFLPL